MQVKKALKTHLMKPKSKIDAIIRARGIFEKMFNHNVLQLLEVYP
jgi:hypothetical protein